MRNQVLHVFRKDVRHHWPEIGLSLVALVAYAWRQMEILKLAGVASSGGGEFLWSLSSSLLPVLWVVLIVRVVQGEILVGDRQFWVTRPYEWKKLLAAKLLFVLVFLNIPLLLLQVFLLSAAGFSPTAHLGHLLWNQLLWLAFVILSAVAISTIVRNVAQFLLVVVGTLLSALTAAEFIQFVPGIGVSGADSIPDSVTMWVALASLVVVVFLQYRFRITAASRILLIGTAVFIALVFALAPYRLLINRAYPQAATGHQPAVTFAFDPASPRLPGISSSEKGKVQCEIPLNVAGIAPGYEVRIGGQLATIQAPGREPWSSGWQESGGDLSADVRNMRVSLTVDKGFFEQVKAMDVQVRIEFALMPQHARASERTTVQPEGLTVAGDGHCSFPGGGDELECMFPLSAPYVLVTANTEDIPCSLQQDEKPLPVGTTIYANSGRWSDLTLMPVRSTGLHFSNPQEALSDGAHPPHICPGTRVTVFSDWEDLPRFRQEVEISGIRLADYRLVDSGNVRLKMR